MSSSNSKSFPQLTVRKDELCLAGTSTRKQTEASASSPLPKGRKQVLVPRDFVENEGAKATISSADCGETSMDEFMEAAIAAPPDVGCEKWPTDEFIESEITSDSLLNSSSGNENVSGAGEGRSGETSERLPTPNEDHVISKSSLIKLFDRVDPTCEPSENLLEGLGEYSDEFVEKVIDRACMIAAHRKSKQVEASDIKLSLEQNFNMDLSESGDKSGKDEGQRNVPKRKLTSMSRKQRLAVMKGDLKKH